MSEAALDERGEEIGSRLKGVGQTRVPERRLGGGLGTGAEICNKSAPSSASARSGSQGMAERPSEDDLIARFFAPLAGPEGLGLRDDAALLTPRPGSDLVLTKDALVAGVHFFGDDPPAAIACKALRVNLSDLAGKGAEPVGFLMALALPADWTADWLEAFARGLGDDASAYGCPLFGGDTVKTPGPLMVSITALGRVEQGKMVARTGVKAGDALYVSGTIGDAALGLKLRLEPEPSLDAASRDFLLGRYLLPEPRVALAPALRR